MTRESSPIIAAVRTESPGPRRALILSPLNLKCYCHTQRNCRTILERRHRQRTPFESQFEGHKYQ
jgi:hypothetical protein